MYNKMELTKDSWSQQDYDRFVEYLKSQADEKYKEFSDGLSPDTEFSFGVRVPALRQMSKEIVKGNYSQFLSCKIGVYREEIMIFGLVMALVKCEYPQMLTYIKQYVSMINSWETCDIVSFKGLKKYLPQFWQDVKHLINSENPWSVRYGLGCLMEFYLTDEYIDEVLRITASIHSDEYYIQMMQAWLVATAAAKQRDKTFHLLSSGALDANVQNKAIQKIRDSFRVSKEDKELAKQYKKIIKKG